jgi:hypothetical protein
MTTCLIEHEHCLRGAASKYPQTYHCFLVFRNHSFNLGELRYFSFSSRRLLGVLRAVRLWVGTLMKEGCQGNERRNVCIVMFFFGGRG